MIDGQNMVSDAYLAKRTTPLLRFWSGASRAACWQPVRPSTRALLSHHTVLPDPEVLAHAGEADVEEVAPDTAVEVRS